jgi:uncharacterized membrane protein
VDALTALRTLAAIVLLALAPGYAWMLVLAPRARLAERLVAGAGLSVALVVLALTIGALVGVPVTLPVVLLEVAVLTVLPLLLRAWRARRRRNAAG